MSTKKPSAAQVKPRHVPEKRPGRTGGKRDENRKQRVRDLCGAARKLMLAQGIESVTVDEIVREAGVAKGSFYRYFKDKAELVDTLFEPLGERLRTTLTHAHDAIEAAENDQQLLIAYAGIGASTQAILRDFPNELLLYLQESRAPRTASRHAVADIAEYIANAAFELTDLARDKGLLARVASRVSALAVIGATERMLFEVLSGGDLGATPQQVALGLISIVMNGLAAPQR